MIVLFNKDLKNFNLVIRNASGRPQYKETKILKKERVMQT